MEARQLVLVSTGLSAISTRMNHLSRIEPALASGAMYRLLRIISAVALLLAFAAVMNMRITYGHS